jgi:TatD DNase family protein
MWIDTHCHLDAEEFDADRDAVVSRARAAGVSMLVIPAVDVASFERVRQCAHRAGFAYALGIHPLYVDQAREQDIEILQDAVAAARQDAHFVAIGEIGLDHFVETPDRERQLWFFSEQLKLARRFDLPVLLHVRRAVDAVYKQLRRIDVQGGIAHAFNGSVDQVQRLTERGFKIGFGGTLTYDGSLRIRRLAAELPDDAWVLETDAPDIPPQWLRDGVQLRNEPCELARIGSVFARLRAIAPAQVAALNAANARVVLPRLAALLRGD